MVKKFNINLLFSIAVFFIGIIFSLLFPMYQIPDELTHIQYTYDELGQDYGVYEDYCKEFDTIRLAGNSNEKVNYDKYFNFSIKADYKLQFKIPSIKIIRHIPQAIGILIGHLFNLPILIVVMICEILAALFYAVACYFTLELMPFKKSIMRFVMLLPVVIQQMGSFSYDVVLFSCCFLLIAYILYLKFTKEKITLKDLFILIGLDMAIAIIKIPYVLLILLALLLPIDKLNIDLYKIKINKKFIKKNKAIILILFLLMLISGIFVMTKITIGRTLLAFLLNPVSLIKVLYLTLRDHGTGFIYTIIGNLGWLDTPVCFAFCVLIGISAILFNFFNYDSKKTIKQKFTNKEIIYIVGLFAFLCIIIMLSLYGWTLESVYSIENYSNWSIGEIINHMNSNKIIIYGIQGRYFVPILPIICLPIFFNKISEKLKKYHNYIEMFYFLIVVVYMFFVVLFRYWI